MLESYQWLLEKTKENQLKYSRGYAILDRMNETLEVMKQKKKELVKPTKVKQTQIKSNIAYFLNIIAYKQ
jgi:hypothetical protein